jgi:hypothetical protein
MTSVTIRQNGWRKVRFAGRFILSRDFGNDDQLAWAAQFSVVVQFEINFLKQALCEGVPVNPAQTRTVPARATLPATFTFRAQAALRTDSLG